MTRGHERYALPALVFAALSAVTIPRLRWVLVFLSLTMLANLWYVYSLFYPAPGLPWDHNSVFVYAMSSINVALLVGVFIAAIRPFHPGVTRPQTIANIGPA